MIERRTGRTHSWKKERKRKSKVKSRLSYSFGGGEPSQGPKMPVGVRFVAPPVGVEKSWWLGCCSDAQHSLTSTHKPPSNTSRWSNNHTPADLLSAEHSTPTPPCSGVPTFYSPPRAPGISSPPEHAPGHALLSSALAHPTRKHENEQHNNHWRTKIVIEFCDTTPYFKKYSRRNI